MKYIRSSSACQKEFRKQPYPQNAAPAGVQRIKSKNPQFQKQQHRAQNNNSQLYQSNHNISAHSQSNKIQANSALGKHSNTIKHTKQGSQNGNNGQNNAASRFLKKIVNSSNYMPAPNMNSLIQPNSGNNSSLANYSTQVPKTFKGQNSKRTGGSQSLKPSSSKSGKKKRNQSTAQGARKVGQHFHDQRSQDFGTYNNHF